MPKTYSHLLAAQRMPTEYELVSSKLLYHPRLGFAVRTPVVDFQARYPLTLMCSAWDEFRDPRETTYTRYVQEQRDKENHVDRLLNGLGQTTYDRDLPTAWLTVLGQVFVPMRYPCHGLHMLSAYVAHRAPAGRITIAAAFQTADELRRVQRIAYRTMQLMLAHAAFGSNAQDVWEREPALQPLRECIERLLVCYEWGEAFVALNLVLKPLFDEFLCMQLTNVAREQRDDVLAHMLLSLHEDQRWHRAWVAALVRHVLADAPDNAQTMQKTLETWQPRMRDALAGLIELLAPVRADRAGTAQAILSEQQRFLEACGLVRMSDQPPWQTEAST
jgi:toluene monooxygenase system protein E